MDVLLDTCTFLWWTSGSGAIPQALLKRLRDPDTRVWLSAASTWEIAVKYSLGKLPLPAEPEVWVPDVRERHQIEALPISEEDALHIRKLPLLHRDPFDRMLVAQAICHDLIIVTPDPLVRAYPCRCIF